MEAVNELRKVYESLMDDESREIFKLRMEYLLTGDYRSIETITKKYLPSLMASPYLTPYEVMQKAGKRDIIVYSAGGDSAFFKSYWKQFPNGKIVAFCDKNEVLQNDGFLGFKVISPDQLINEYKDAFVVISSTRYGAEIRNDLLKAGFMSEQIYDQLFPTLSVYEKQYFDPRIITFPYDGTEVYVDGGSLDLSSVVQLSKLTKVKKAYAFEPNREHFKNCEKIKEQFDFEVELFPYGLWSEKDELRFEMRNDGGSHLNGNGNEVINVCAMEDVIPAEEKITFIKMDIEGAELEALKGCCNIIKRDKPKLAICIYHKPEDMYEIPMYIKELVPEYKLYIRAYSNRQFETILYAVL